MKGIGDYKLLEEIGAGSYGKVYKGIHRETEEFVAIKIISHDKFAKNPQLELYTINQINILTELADAQGIARYLNVLKSANNYYFIYEYCNGGTLKKIIDDCKNKSETLPLTQAVKYFGQILNAFKLLTKNKTMHRDIKPANILLHDGKIKIADFGLSKCLKSPTDVAETMVGSPLYMAPEILKGESYTMKADIWSLGVVFYQMVYGRCPFDSRDIGKLIEVQKTQEIKYPKLGNSVVENVLRKMLVKEPTKRIDWSELFEYKIVGGDIVEPNTSPTRYLHPPHRQSTQQIRYNSPSYETNIRTNLNHHQERAQNINYPNRESSQNKLRQHLDNHQKIIRASELSISILKQSPKQSIYLSFLINKTIQRQLNQILETLNKLSTTKSYSLKTQNDMKISSFKEMIVDELIELKCSLKVSREIIEALGEDVNKMDLKKYRYLKSFYKFVRSELTDNEEIIIMISQMIDLFSESIIVKKEVYRKTSKGEVIKEIERKLSQLN